MNKGTGKKKIKTGEGYGFALLSADLTGRLQIGFCPARWPS